ncbi:MAG: FlgD immunoglobulin-like domain containing protein [Candidatus Krumholzibacteria bacterium]|jgi:hypothetical protein|nr:FlgD immunoglobulin-like domain containing protein [Candidatus Krumholzibacteria bacterium]
MRITRPVSLVAAAVIVLAGGAAAQWSNDPAVNLIAGGGPGEQTVPHVAVVPAGGAYAGFIYVGWYDNASGNYDVALQLLSPHGVALFPAGGLIVSDQPQASWVMDWSLTADQDGNAIVSFADIRDGDSNIQVYKISPAAEFLWGPHGISLSTGPDFKGPPAAAVAADGDVVVAWMQEGAPTGVRMQRLAPDGALRLAAGGVIVSEPGDTSPAGNVLVPTGPSDVILGYVPVYSFMGNRQIKTQRFDALGQPVWPSYLMVMDDSTLPMGHYFQMTADSEGGALFCWNVTVGWAFGCCVQRVNAAGHELLPHNGASANAGGATGQIEPSAVYDPATGEITMVFVAMNEAQSQRGLSAQRFDAAGQRLWGPAGSVLLPQDADLEVTPRLVLLDGAPIGTVLHQPGGQYGSERVLAYRLDDAGGLVWAGGTIEAASTPSSKGSLQMAASTLTTVAVWKDERSGDPDVYAQNVNADGTLGEPIVVIEDDPSAPPPAPARQFAAHPAYPNPFNPLTTIAFDLPRDARVRLRIHDVAGRLVRELVDADLTAGSHRIAWDGTDRAGSRQPSGVYFYQLITPERTATRAMTLVQ